MRATRPSWKRVNHVWMTGCGPSVNALFVYEYIRIIYLLDSGDTGQVAQEFAYSVAALPSPIQSV